MQMKLVDSFLGGRTLGGRTPRGRTPGGRRQFQIPKLVVFELSRGQARCLREGVNKPAKTAKRDAPRQKRLAAGGSVEVERIECGSSPDLKVFPPC